MEQPSELLTNGYLYNFLGHVDKLPCNPKLGDIYMVKDKLFIWINNKWYMLNPKPSTLRQKIQLVIDNMELTEEQLKNAIQSILEE